MGCARARALTKSKRRYYASTAVETASLGKNSQKRRVHARLLDSTRADPFSSSYSSARYPRFKVFLNNLEETRESEYMREREREGGRGRTRKEKSNTNTRVIKRTIFLRKVRVKSRDYGVELRRIRARKRIRR